MPDLVIDPAFGGPKIGDEDVSLAVATRLATALSAFSVEVTRSHARIPRAERHERLAQGRFGLALHHGQRSWAWPVLAAVAKNGGKARLAAERIIRRLKSDFGVHGTVEVRSPDAYGALAVAPQTIILYSQLMDMDREAASLAVAIGGILREAC